MTESFWHTAIVKWFLPWSKQKSQQLSTNRLLKGWKLKIIHAARRGSLYHTKVSLKPIKSWLLFFTLVADRHHRAIISFSGSRALAAPLKADNDCYKICSSSWLQLSCAVWLLGCLERPKEFWNLKLISISLDAKLSWFSGLEACNIVLNILM